MEFGPGILGGEAPLDDRLGLVALPLQGADIVAEAVLVRVLCPRQRRDMTLNSISAIFSQLPCLAYEEPSVSPHSH